MSVVAVVLQGSESTAGGIIESIPRDPSAFLVYALMVMFLGLIWVGSRKRS